jgi:hypothetical protein
MHTSMRTRKLPMSLWVLATIISYSVLPAIGIAQDQSRDQVRDQTREQTRDQTREQTIYGSQLMTEQERNEYRQRMRNVKTNEERETLRLEHHNRMKERARERGVSLPDQPPEKPYRGQGSGGPGMGYGGQGMGSGGGKGGR